LAALIRISEAIFSAFQEKRRTFFSQDYYILPSNRCQLPAEISADSPGRSAQVFLHKIIDAIASAVGHVRVNGEYLSEIFSSRRK